jgi:hypothetical protein
LLATRYDIFEYCHWSGSHGIPIVIHATDSVGLGRAWCHGAVSAAIVFVVVDKFVVTKEVA